MPPIPVFGPGVVYFARLSDGRTKIGVTSDWDKRKKAHVANGLVIQDEMLIYVTQGRMMERYYHDKYKDKRVDREFFDLNNDDWLAVVEDAQWLSVFDEPAVSTIVFAPWMNSEIVGCTECGFAFLKGKLGAPEMGCIFCGSKLESVEVLAVPETAVL